MHSHTHAAAAGTPPDLAQPFRLEGGAVGILMVHGFTGTPYIFREIGGFLHEEGYTVSAPLLVGHGTHPEHLDGTTWQDWYASVEQAYDDLRPSCRKIFVLGASFGGNLACYLASRRPVDGIILVGMPRWIRRQAFIRVAVPVLRRMGMKSFRKPLADSDMRHLGSMLGGPTLSYVSIPLSSLTHFFEFIGRRTEECLPKIASPCLIIQSRFDSLVKPASGPYILRHIGSDRKRLVWATDKEHHLPSRADRLMLCREIGAFLGQEARA